MHLNVVNKILKWTRSFTWNQGNFWRIILTWLYFRDWLLTRCTGSGWSAPFCLRRPTDNAITQQYKKLPSAPDYQDYIQLSIWRTTAVIGTTLLRLLVAEGQSRGMAVDGGSMAARIPYDLPAISESIDLTTFPKPLCLLSENWPVTGRRRHGHRSSWSICQRCDLTRFIGTFHDVIL